MNKQQLTDALTEGIREGRINPAERDEALALFHQIYTTAEVDEDSPSHTRLCTIVSQNLDQSPENLRIKVEVERITQADAEFNHVSTDENEKREILRRATVLEWEIARNKQMISNPLVSVIIPVFNVKLYLTEALNSVISQTYEKLEVIIIDDGSTDGSGEICDEYANNDKRIIVFHQDNKGLSAARNVGLDIMTGEVCAFLDSDDAYENTFVEKLLAVMTRENADLVVCKYTSHKTDGRLVWNGEPASPTSNAGKYDHVHSLRALADGTINVNVWNKLYRRELWEEIRFPDGHVYEDIDTSFRIFNLCNMISILDDPLYLRRIRSGSITATSSMKNIQDRTIACSHFASFMEMHIPEIFTQIQVRKWRQSTLNRMIFSYVRYTDRKDSDDNFYERLRNQIITTGKEAGIDTLTYREKVAWYIIRDCPWLLTIVYPVYRPLSQLVYRITGK